MSLMTETMHRKSLTTEDYVQKEFDDRKQCTEKA